MSAELRRPPSYCLHKSSGQARVIINGKHIYLGKYGTAESHEKYHRLVAEWLASGRVIAPSNPGLAAGGQITVNELILAFWRFAEKRYVKNGSPTSEQRSFRTALKPVRQLYGHKTVSEFGPLALVACREQLINGGICRKRINQHVGRIRQMFKWGVSRELVPETVWRHAVFGTGIEGWRGAGDPACKIGGRATHCCDPALCIPADLGDGEYPALDRMSAG